MDFAGAAENATVALDIEPSKANGYLLADALTYGGRYREARRLFVKHLAAGPADPADCIWRLKLRALEAVRSLVGDGQDRRPDASQQLADQADLEDPALSVQ